MISIIFIKTIKIFNYFHEVAPQILPFSFGDDELNLYDTISATCTVSKGDKNNLEIWWTVIEADDPNSVEKILNSNDEIEIRTNKKISMMSIDSVKARHRGNFSCHAKNRAGEVSVTAQLAINGDSYINSY